MKEEKEAKRNQDLVSWEIKSSAYLDAKAWHATLFWVNITYVCFGDPERF